MDVDMQVYGDDSNPVENIFFANPQRGNYSVYVYNYTDRTPGSNTTAVVRITIAGRSTTYNVVVGEEYDNVLVASFDY